MRRLGEAIDVGLVVAPRVLGEVAPRDVAGAAGSVGGRPGVALGIQGIVLVLQAVGQHQVFLAAEGRGEPVQDAQQLLDAIRTGLLQHVHRHETGAQVVDWFLAILSREGFDHAEVGRRVGLGQAALPEVDP